MPFPIRSFILPLVALAPTIAVAQSLPESVQGSWDRTPALCAAGDTSVTRVEVSARQIDTFGGPSTVRAVTQTGPVTYVAADYQQLEGVQEVADPEATFFRLTQRQGPDQMNFIWKDVEEVDLVRCSAVPATTTGEGVLPLEPGSYTMSGTGCDAAGNAGVRIYDGVGVYGTTSVTCDMQVLEQEGPLYVTREVCRGTYDGTETLHRDVVRVLSPTRFALLEEGASVAQVFDWCDADMRR